MYTYKGELIFSFTRSLLKDVIDSVIYRKGFNNSIASKVYEETLKQLDLSDDNKVTKDQLINALESSFKIHCNLQ